MSWKFLVEWTSRMAKKYGGIVYDKEMGKTWDWGQALAREMYGPEWNKNSDFEKEDEQDSPNPETVERAKRWEAGEHPKWARYEKPSD